VAVGAGEEEVEVESGGVWNLPWPSVLKPGLSVINIPPEVDLIVKCGEYWILKKRGGVNHWMIETRFSWRRFNFLAFI